MRIYKEERVENKILALASVLALAATLFISAAVLAADNDTGQSASTAKTTTFLVGGSEAGTKDTNLTTITFPEGAPAATISNPSNNLDAADPQVLSATVSEPVAHIKNTHGSASYSVVLEITTWTNSLIDMEYYNLAADDAVNIEAVTSELSNASGASRTVSTGVSIAAGTYKDLYLKLVYGSVSGKSSTSTLTILGETP